MDEESSYMFYNFRNVYGIFSNQGANSPIEGKVAYCLHLNNLFFVILGKRSHKAVNCQRNRFVPCFSRRNDL